MVVEHHQRGDVGEGAPDGGKAVAEVVERLGLLDPALHPLDRLGHDHRRVGLARKGLGVGLVTHLPLELRELVAELGQGLRPEHVGPDEEIHPHELGEREEVARPHVTRELGDLEHGVLAHAHRGVPVLEEGATLLGGELLLRHPERRHRVGGEGKQWVGHVVGIDLVTGQQQLVGTGLGRVGDGSDDLGDHGEHVEPAAVGLAARAVQQPQRGGSRGRGREAREPGSARGGERQRRARC